MIYPTPYLPAQSLGRIRQAYNGGFCRWWYTYIQYIASFPEVDPENQQLRGEPVLKEGRTWYGPVNVPDGQLGFEESTQTAKAGIWYKQQVEGTMPGINANAHANLGNLMQQQVCIIGKLRAGGQLLILGNAEAGLELEHTTTSGQGNNGVPGNKLQFNGESIYKSLMLPSFGGISLPPIETPFGTGSNNTNDMAEIITFTSQETITLIYTSARRAKYGSMPAIEVWYIIQEDGVEKVIKANVEIQTDQPPPNQTQFIILNGGAATGFIRLGK